MNRQLHERVWRKSFTYVMDVSERSKKGPQRFLRDQRRQSPNKYGSVIGISRRQLLAIRTDEVPQDSPGLRMVFPRLLRYDIPRIRILHLLLQNLSNLDLMEIRIGKTRHGGRTGVESHVFLCKRKCVTGLFWISKGGGRYTSARTSGRAQRIGRAGRWRITAKRHIRAGSGDRGRYTFGWRGAGKRKSDGNGLIRCIGIRWRGEGYLWKVKCG